MGWFRSIDQSHVIFCWKERSMNWTAEARTCSLFLVSSEAEFKRGLPLKFSKTHHLKAGGIKNRPTR